MTTCNVLLIEHEARNSELEACLKQQHYNVLKLAFNSLSIALLKTIAPDIIIFVLHAVPQQLLLHLKTIRQQQALPIIVFTAETTSEIIEQLIEAEVNEIIINNFDTSDIATIITLAIARFKYQQQLSTALAEARAQLEDRKAIDKAKGILMKTQGFNEEVAYHTLRKLAMDRNITVGAMAKHVIAMAELLK